MLSANIECQYGASGCPQSYIACIWGLHMAAQELYMAAYGCPKAAYGCSEGSLGWLWGCIWLLRGCNGLPMGLHMAGQRLHLAAEGLHFAAEGLSAAPMQQICSICCVWLGQAGQPGSWEYAQMVVVGRSGAPNCNSRQQMAMKTVKMHSKLKTEDCRMHSRLKTDGCQRT